ncbi:hypothetical protein PAPPERLAPAPP_04330 [Brevundimonas phage vB_BpoS-Papperlapapp]|uniref:Uncharacterized protein n=1 Tax=Brevundimonas phage vB_BpoS-Domovoi TaxID=2948598 RepID=A0A9E7SMF7_9CAUD|nr:hypothetical protein DOMOVOI_03280 [Brevundimonas phage vB_BpoS-Domovoi]USN16174.1 hypothetical protein PAPPERLAPAPP_04330 [Brevundimonas phage vB_BpoS-Papperlapapp]
MTDGVESPLEHRQPRRGDKVVSARFGDVAVEGVVVSFASGRLTLQSPKDGRLTLPIQRFTWKPRAKHWVCWPADMLRHMKTVLQAEEAHARARYGLEPRVGDFCLISGRAGWISHYYAKPVRADPRAGAIFNALAGYEITTAAGPVRIECGQITYDAEERRWIAAP